MSKNLKHNIPKALLSIFILFGAFMYFTKTDYVRHEFAELGFPMWLVIPLGIAKICGIAAIWAPKHLVPHNLKVMAYSGLFFNLCLAASAHIMHGDDEILPPVIALVILSITYFTSNLRRI